jgi:hypothetical protein
MEAQVFYDASAAGQYAGELPSSLVRREDGIYFKADAPAALLQAAVNQVYLSSAYFSGLDYGVFLRALYNAGPELPEGIRGQPLLRFADDILPFKPDRRDLYKSVRIVNGEAEYYFEPVFVEVEGQAAQQAQLDFGEFVADMWVKGIRFGIDAPVVKEAIASGKPVRLVVARKLPPAPGRDAAIVEVSEDIHRSNAPRMLANGRFDLHTFQNRFPQVPARTRLLKKEPPTPGVRGFELSGIVLEPPAPRDLEMTSVAGEGTVVEHIDGDDYLVSAVEGFLNVDSSSKRISIGPKIVSREGVSVRTTGNLQLKGEFEEFGDVQEQRTVEGLNITVHGDVFGNISSRGGSISLQKNLMGGSAINADGSIRVKGVASGAVVQAKNGEVVLNKAQNCVITGTRVVITEAYNCDIMADEVLIRVCEGCAVAARKVEIENAGPRKQAEMLVHVLVPDTTKYDQKMQELRQKAAQFAAQAAKRQSEIDTITGEPDVRNYLTLASKVRKQEVALTPEQLPLFQKMAVQVGPSLRIVGKLSLAVKEARVQQQQAEEQVALVQKQKLSVIGTARCTIRHVTGDMLVRKTVFNPDLGPAYHYTPKEVTARLRAAVASDAPLFNGSFGSVDWSATADL